MGSFTVYGEACGELLRAQEGRPARDDDERALRVATLVYMNMGKGADQRRAVALLKLVAREGLEAAAMVCTAGTSRPSRLSDAVPLGQEVAVVKAKAPPAKKTRR